MSKISCGKNVLYQVSPSPLASQNPIHPIGFLTCCQEYGFNIQYDSNVVCIQVSDGGLYECQISTTPVMSHHVYLKVAG